MSIGRVPGVTGIQPSIVDAKGDLIVATAADSVDRLAVGTNNHVLTADSATATGLKWAALPASGKVLQVVSATTTSGATITSTTFTDSNLTASITPSATSSKVLVLVTQAMLISTQDSNGQGAWARIMRGSTSVFENERGLILTSGLGGGGAAAFQSWYPMTYLDSPNTTSSVTYKTQFRCTVTTSATTVIAQVASMPSSIVLLEIGA